MSQLANEGREEYKNSIKFYIKECGNSIFMQDRDPKAMLELQDAIILVEEDKLYKADRLNGIQWAGKFYIFAPLQRTYYADKGWTPWAQIEQHSNPAFGVLTGYYASYFPMRLIKRDGKWEIPRIQGKELFRHICGYLKSLK